MGKVIGIFLVAIVVVGLILTVTWDSPKELSLPPSADMGGEFAADILDTVPEAVQMEADSMLGIIYQRQKEMYAETQCYDTLLANLGIEPPPNAKNRYSMRVVCGCGFGYEAYAKSRYRTFVIDDLGQKKSYKTEPDFHW